MLWNLIIVLKWLIFVWDVYVEVHIILVWHVGAVTHQLQSWEVMMPVREAFQKELGAFTLNDQKMCCQGHFTGEGIGETTAGGEVGGGVAKQ